MTPPKRADDGRRLGSKEKGRAKKKLVGDRALADLAAWLAGDPVRQAAE
jgi:methylenetetrahydrofolate--tRNA-(uracil-5-)-methyltransferase